MVETSKNQETNKNGEKMISVYGGTGFIGSKFANLVGGCVVSKHQNKPPISTTDIVYFISTTDNYHIYDNPYLDIDTNLNKLIDVLEECRKTNIIFNFISSWFVYGVNNSRPVKEWYPCDPKGFYSITKRTAEQLLISYCEIYNIKYRILRLTNIIGETDKGVSKRKNAIQFLIKQLLINEPIELYDRGTPIRDYMYVDDCVRAIQCCVKNAPLNEIVNISNGEPIQIGTIIDYVRRKVESKSKITYIDAPKFHETVQAKDMYLDNTKLLSYGYKPSIGVFKAIDNIIGCYGRN